jgi:hypothetical protein
VQERPEPTAPTLNLDIPTGKSAATIALPDRRALALVECAMSIADCDICST